ncbi:hypothetical protein DEI84_01445 [Curtobacterium sp. MCBD17_023]|nr:hypothetical protein DEI84_01445 [Curtobacterium sp. MCBD17_023]
MRRRPSRASSSSGSSSTGSATAPPCDHRCPGDELLRAVGDGSASRDDGQQGGVIGLRDLAGHDGFDVVEPCDLVLDGGELAEDAVHSGFTKSGAVLVAAATIMAVVFAGFATSEMAVAASIAVGLLVGVLADAFLVRMMIMPALLSLCGEAAWWMPRWMQKIIPNLDTEGHGLDRATERQRGTGSISVAAQ